MIKAWLFDLDGTLADTAPDLASALNYVLQNQGKKPLDIATVRPYAAFGSAKLIELGFGENHADADGLRKQLLDFYEQNVALQTRLFSGMLMVLSRLKANNIKIAIVTNKPVRFTQPLLEQLRINGRFSCVVSGAVDGKSKPHPDPILYALKHLGISAKEALYVGDSTVDVAACKAAGVKMISAAYGYLQPEDDPEQWHTHAVINHPTELLNFI